MIFIYKTVSPDSWASSSQVKTPARRPTSGSNEESRQGAPTIPCNRGAEPATSRETVVRAGRVASPGQSDSRGKVSGGRQ